MFIIKIYKNICYPLRAKLVLSNPSTQRKIELRVKRFIEILVNMKTEFVFFFSVILVADILLYCKASLYSFSNLFTDCKNSKK